MTPLDTIVLGNSLQAWLVAATIFVVGAGALLFARRVLAHRLALLAQRTATDFDDVAVDLLKRTRVYFILVIAFTGAIQVLEVAERVHNTVRWLSIIALLLQVGVWSTGLLAYWLQKWALKHGDDRGSATTIAAFGVFARFCIWLVLGLVALQNLGVNVTTLVTGLGITGVAVALAVQNILGDLFAALSIVLDKPFVVGDTIAVDTMTGTVERVGLKTTRVRALSGEQVIFSNADLLRSRVRNITSLRERRVVFTLGVTFDTSGETLARVPTILREIVEQTPNLRFDRSHFTRIGESALEFETVYWVTTADYAMYKDAAQVVNLGIVSRFAENGVSFAFPTHTVMVAGGAEPSAAVVAGAAATPSQAPRSAAT